MEILRKEFHQRKNISGTLSFVEGEMDFPFPIRRVYYLYDIEPDVRRGFHAHKALEQYLICVHGSCRVLLDDGREKKEVLLDNPNEGLYVGPSTWREMYDFSEGAVLLVLASEHYDESDYIRDYGSFLDYIQKRDEKSNEC